MAHIILQDIPKLLFAHGVKHLVLSPGSRSAPLVMAFAAFESIQIQVVPDERSAAYVALGMIQALQAPVAILCTSGTAAINYHPAVAEAFFQHLPLIVLTADRPAEWVGQGDGQTVFQENLYGKHVKKSYQVPADLEHAHAQWALVRDVQEACVVSTKHPQGPVHLNFSMREPLYQWEGTKTFVKNKDKDNDKAILNSESKLNSESILNFESKLNFEIKPNLNSEAWKKVSSVIEKSQKIWLVAGSAPYSFSLIQALVVFSASHACVVLADANSNLHTLPNAITLHDSFAANISQDDLPDLMITWGYDVISKSLKNKLRALENTCHIRIESGETATDMFMGYDVHVPVLPLDFFQILNSLFKDTLDIKSLRLEYVQRLILGQEKCQVQIQSLMSQNSDSEPAVFAKIWEAIPETACVHLGNSLPARYPGWLGINHKKVKICINRGASGIDGSVSTALGYALARPEEKVVLIIGDMSFMYDRNGLWVKEIPSNLTIIVLDNQGGQIFDVIDGPKTTEVKDRFFVTDIEVDLEAVLMSTGLAVHRPDRDTDWREFFKEKGKIEARLAYVKTGRPAEMVKLIKNLAW